MKCSRESLWAIIGRTVLSYSLLFLVIVASLIPIICIMLLPARIRAENYAVYRFLQLVYNTILRCTLVPITYYGLENVPDTPAIFVANHQSILDVPLVGVVMGRNPHHWLASSALLAYPHLRLLLPRFCQMVDTSSPQRAMSSLLKMVRYGKKYSSHLVLFPEGQRYADGLIHDFYGGFVILATQTGRPVVPVRIFNAHLVYPYGSILVHRYPITVVVGQPLYKGVDETDSEYKKRVYDWFVHQGRD